MVLKPFRKKKKFKLYFSKNLTWVVHVAYGIRVHMKHLRCTPHDFFFSWYRVILHMVHTSLIDQTLHVCVKRSD
jgi:hypothetical protein